MTRSRHTCAVAALAAAVAGAACTWWTDAAAQDSKKGRIVCWKDKSGKVIGCGDRVPAEYQDSATREMDSRGVTRGTTESSEDAARRRVQEQEATRLKAEEAKKLAERQRQDSALLNTFTSEKEIDQKRDRDLQQADNQIGQLKTSLKNAIERYNEVKARIEVASKDKKGKGPSEGLKEELERAATDNQRAEQMVASKEKEREEIVKRYAEQKKRYIELRGEATPTPAPSPAPGPARQAGTK